MSTDLTTLAAAAYDAPAPPDYRQDSPDADRWRVGYLVDMAGDMGTPIAWAEALALIDDAARDVAGEWVRCPHTGNLIAA